MIPDLTPAEIARFYGNLHLGGCGVFWAGSDVNNKGYGRFNIYRDHGRKRVRILAHRLAYKLSTGEDPGDAVIRHGCDIPLCCTPDCLEPGTQADNLRDALLRQRAELSGLAAYRSSRDAAALERLTTGEKRCSRCGELKRLNEDFYRSANSVDGRAYWCKTCAGDYRRDYRCRGAA